MKKLLSLFIKVILFETIYWGIYTMIKVKNMVNNMGISEVCFTIEESPLTT